MNIDSLEDPIDQNALPSLKSNIYYTKKIRVVILTTCLPYCFFEKFDFLTFDIFEV